MVLERTHTGYHGRIVRRVAELGDVDGPSVSLGIVVEGVAQACVGRYATRYGYMLDARLLDGQAQFLHQNIDYRKLQAGCQVLLVMLHKVGILGHPLAQVVEEGRLQSREGVVESWNVGL